MKKKLRQAEEKEVFDIDNKKKDAQLKWVLAGMVIIFLIVIAVYFIIDSLKKFEYGGLKFEKIKYGELPLFYSRIPIKTITGNVVAYYNMYLRNDPRELENIEVDGTIFLTKNSVLSIDPSIEGCTDNGIAGVSLGTFFNAADMTVTYASTNKTLADEKQMEYATCDDAVAQTVIIIKQEDENRIYKEKDNCYIISFKDCEIIKAVERFIVAASAHSKGIDV